MWEAVKSRWTGRTPQTANLPQVEQSTYADELRPLLESGLQALDPLSTQEAPSATSWKKACEVYRQRISKDGEDAIHTATSLSPLLLVVADMLCDQHRQTTPEEASRVVHISHSHAGLIAAYSPAERMVQWRIEAKDFEWEASDVTLRVMPASVKLIRGDSSKDFESIPFAWLMWQFGQHALPALAQVPSLVRKQLVLFRFPAVNPITLKLRHLKLIHAISRARLQFEDLMAALPPENAEYICPDLASLYLCGALRLKRIEAN